MKKLSHLYLILLFILSNSHIFCDPQTITAHKVKDISVDGILSESEYKIFSPVDQFTQREPSEGKPASEITNAWIFYNDTYLFVCGKMYDKNPDSIDVNLSRRDSGFDSDLFWFFVDPYQDKKTGYVFTVSAGGSILDGTIYNDTKVDFLWDGIWLAKTSVDNAGWNFEIRIPFSQLRFKNSQEMIWGVNLNRDIKRKKEQSFTTMIPRKEGIFVSGFGALTGLNGISSVQRFEALPYFVNKLQYLAHKPNDPFYKENLVQSSVGVDLKFGINTNLTIDAAINPDFGQVEVDPAVVNLTAFETFFEEKRPFFVEGSKIFSFGEGGKTNNWSFDFDDPQLFYSRRIGRVPQGNISSEGFVNFPNKTRIIAAAKLTGKLDESWSIGGMGAVTEKTFAQIQMNNGKSSIEVEPLTHFEVFRTQKEFNEGKQALGLMATSVIRKMNDVNLNNQLSNKAFTIGADGWTYLDENENFILTGSFIRSYSQGSKEYIVKLQKQPYRYFQRPDASSGQFDSNRISLGGWFTRFTLNKQKGNFYFNASLGAVSPEFEYNDLGYQWFADKINGALVIGYRWFTPDHIFRTKDIYFASFRNYDFKGKLLSSGLFTSSKLEFLNYYGIDLKAYYNFESFNRTLTRGGPFAKDPNKFSLDVSGYSDNRERLIISPEWNFWFDGLGSSSYSLILNLEWKLNSQINFSVGPEYSFGVEKRQWVGNFYDLNAVQTYNYHYVFGELDQQIISANIRLNWTFTPAISLQLFVQPLIAVGNYNSFKELSKPGSLEFNYFNSSELKFDASLNSYKLKPSRDPSKEIIFENPDFNIKSFRGNIVLRIEATPGTTFYFVWTKDKMNFDDPGDLNFQRDLKNLWNSSSNDIFLIKLTYWFDTHSLI